MLEEHGEHLAVVSATEVSDQEAIEEFRSTTGATWPMLYGLREETKEAYDAPRVPALRVIDRKGNIVGHDLESLREELRRS